MSSQLKSWEDDMCYSTPSFVKHEVNGKLQKFYAASPGLLLEFQGSGKKIIAAVSDLFAKTERDFKTTDRAVKAEGGTERTITAEPVTLEVAQYRDKQRAEAWTNAFQAITDRETLLLVCKVIMDSLVEVFPKDDSGRFNREGKIITPEDFLAKTPIKTLVQMVIGTAKGNADVFGPLGVKASSFLEHLVGAVSIKAEELVKEKTEKQTSAASDHGNTLKTGSPS